jgi:hypothetical protein
MADDNAVSTDTQAQDAAASEDTLGDAGKKALEAERRNARAAAKERDALAARLKEFEDRDKSEATRALERAEAAEKAAAAAEARALRLEVASEKGLTPAQAKRLVGETREELEADADELVATFKPAESDDPDPSESVTESLDLGIRTGSPQKGKSTADLFAAAIDGSFTR